MTKEQLEYLNSDECVDKIDFIEEITFEETQRLSNMASPLPDTDYEWAMGE